MEYQNQLEKIRAFLKTDRAILIGCIGMAFLIWLFTKLSQRYQSEINVAVTYTIPEKRIIAGSAPQKIPILIEAGGWQLVRKYFTSNKSTINLLLEENKDFQTFSSIQLSSMASRNFNTNLKVLSGSLDPITIRMDDKSFKRIPVRLRESVTLAAQFQLSDTIRIMPDSVTVSGPEFVINSLSHWETENLNLKDLKKSQNAPLLLKKHQVETVSFQPAVVTCKINVEQYTENAFEVPLVVENAPSNSMYIVLPTSVEVKFVVGLGLYESITANRFMAVADFSKIDTLNPVPIPIRLKEIPPGIKNVSFQPKTAQFYINK